MLVETFRALGDWYMANMNYGTITFLMALESTFVPLPSEIVIPPAAWKAADPTSSLNLGLVILFGTIGCVIGALFNYFLAFFLGRKIIYGLADSKYARLFLVKRESVEKAEAYFIKHGRSSTFIGRLVPGVRHLISIPAGLAKMNLKDFILYTFVGSAIWNSCLALLGYYFYSKKEILNMYLKELSIALLVLGGLFILYLIIRALIIRAKKKKAATNI